jgi:20S proteasome alpha/beta subunit
MTITISILVPSGIVFAADSRQVIESGTGQLRVDSDNAEKIIQLGPRLAAMVNGQGTFYSSRSESPQAIGDILRIIAKTLPKNSTAKNSADFLHKRITAILKKHLEVIKAKQAGISFYVAGYGLGNEIGELYRCDIPGGITLERKTNDAGAVWNGEHAIINRLILGYDQRLFEALLSSKMSTEQRETLGQSCRGMQLHINFQTMPLQDAIDLAVLLVHTTIELQRISDGLVGVPFQFPICGGAIDVAVITQAEDFRWLQHKSLEIRAG